MTFRPTRSLIACAGIAGLAIGAFVLQPGSRPAPAPASPTTGSEAVLTIEGFAFSATTAAPGATVSVTNRDGAPHTVTATDGAFDTGTVQPGASTTFQAPAAPGTYDLFCAIHPSMTASLTVR
jgi:plastocyanin